MKISPCHLENVLAKVKGGALYTPQQPDDLILAVDGTL